MKQFLWKTEKEQFYLFNFFVLNLSHTSSSVDCLQIVHLVGGECLMQLKVILYFVKLIWSFVNFVFCVFRSIFLRFV